MRTAVVICSGDFSVTPAPAQGQAPDRVFRPPEFKVEPTITFSNVFGSPRLGQEDGTLTREPRAVEFEVILSFGLPTRVPWLEFTVEGIFLPFDRDSTPELEFETNFVWLGWGAHARVGQLDLRHRQIQF